MWPSDQAFAVGPSISKEAQSSISSLASEIVVRWVSGP